MGKIFSSGCFSLFLLLSAIFCAQYDSKSNDIVSQEDLSKEPILCLLPVLVPEGVVPSSSMTNPTLRGLEHLEDNAFLIPNDYNELWHLRPLWLIWPIMRLFWLGVFNPESEICLPKEILAHIGYMLIFCSYRASLALHNLSNSIKLSGLSKIIRNYPFIDSLDLSPHYDATFNDSTIILLKKEIYKMMKKGYIRAINIRDVTHRFEISNLLAGISNSASEDIGPCANLERIGLTIDNDKQLGSGIKIIAALKYSLKAIALEGSLSIFSLPELLMALKVHSLTLESLHLRLCIFGDKQVIENFTKQFPLLTNLRHFSIRILNDAMLNWVLVLLPKLNRLEYLDLEMKMTSLNDEDASALASHLVKLSNVRLSVIENADVLISLLQHLAKLNDVSIRSLSFEPKNNAVHHAKKLILNALIAFLNISSKIEHLTMSWVYDTSKMPPEMFKGCKSLEKLTLICSSFDFSLELFPILKDCSIKYLDIQIHHYAASHVKDFLKFASSLKGFSNLRSFSFHFVEYEKFMLPKTAELIQKDWDNVRILAQQWTQEGKRLEIGFYIPELGKTWNSLWLGNISQVIWG